MTFIPKHTQNYATTPNLNGYTNTGGFSIVGGKLVLDEDVAVTEDNFLHRPEWANVPRAQLTYRIEMPAVVADNNVLCAPEVRTIRGADFLRWRIYPNRVEVVNSSGGLETSIPHTGGQVLGAGKSYGFTLRPNPDQDSGNYCYFDYEVWDGVSPTMPIITYNNGIYSPGLFGATGNYSFRLGLASSVAANNCDWAVTGVTVSERITATSGIRPNLTGVTYPRESLSFETATSVLAQTPGLNGAPISFYASKNGAINYDAWDAADMGGEDAFLRVASAGNDHGLTWNLNGVSRREGILAYARIQPPTGTLWRNTTAVLARLWAGALNAYAKMQTGSDNLYCEVVGYGALSVAVPFANTSDIAAIGIRPKNGGVAFVYGNAETYHPSIHDYAIFGRGGLPDAPEGSDLFPKEGLIILEGDNVGWKHSHPVVNASGLGVGDDTSGVTDWTDIAIITPTPEVSAKQFVPKFTGNLHAPRVGNARDLALAKQHKVRHFRVDGLGDRSLHSLTNGAIVGAENKVCDIAGAHSLSISGTQVYHNFDWVDAYVDVWLEMWEGYTDSEVRVHVGTNYCSPLMSANYKDLPTATNGYALYTGICADIYERVRQRIATGTNPGGTPRNPDVVMVWNCWNEADSANFANFSIAQFCDLHCNMANRFQTIWPDIQIGGPDFASWNLANYTQFFEAIKQFRIANNITTRSLFTGPVSLHIFNGEPTYAAFCVREVKKLLDLYLYLTAKVAVTEYGPNIYDGDQFNPFGGVPGNGLNQGTHAAVQQALTAMSIFEDTPSGLVDYINYFGWHKFVWNLLLEQPWGAADDVHVFAHHHSRGFISAIANRANAKQLAVDISNCRPGTRVFAFKDNVTGTVDALCVGSRYKNPHTQRTVTLRFGGTFTGTVSTHDIVDSQHSSFAEGGATHEALESGAPLTVSGGDIAIAGRRDRSVHHVVIDTVAPVQEGGGSSRRFMLNDLSLGLHL